MVTPADYDITQMTVAEAKEIFAEIRDFDALNRFARQEIYGRTRKGMMAALNRRCKWLIREFDCGEDITKMTEIEAKQVISRTYLPDALHAFDCQELFGNDRNEVRYAINIQSLTLQAGGLNITQMTETEAKESIAKICDYGVLEALEAQESSGHVSYRGRKSPLARKAILAAIANRRVFSYEAEAIIPRRMGSLSQEAWAQGYAKIRAHMVSACVERGHRRDDANEEFDSVWRHNMNNMEDAVALLSNDEELWIKPGIYGHFIMDMEEEIGWAREDRENARLKELVLWACEERGHRRRDAKEAMACFIDENGDCDGNDPKEWLEITLGQLEMEGRHKHQVVSACVQRGYRHSDAKYAFDSVCRAHYTEYPPRFIADAYGNSDTGWGQLSRTELSDQVQVKPFCLKCRGPMGRDDELCAGCGYKVVKDWRDLIVFERDPAYQFKVFLAFTLWRLDEHDAECLLVDDAEQTDSPETQAESICSQCGTPMEREDRFCSTCGHIASYTVFDPNIDRLRDDDDDDPR